jgi:hypothetical protein
MDDYELGRLLGGLTTAVEGVNVRLTAMEATLVAHNTAIDELKAEHQREVGAVASSARVRGGVMAGITLMVALLGGVLAAFVQAILNGS